MECTYSKQDLTRLRERWIGQGERIDAIIQDLGTGEDWTRHLRKCDEEDRKWEELKDLDRCPGRFQLPEEDAPRDLRGISLTDVSLHEIHGLADTCMDGCILDGVDFDGASLMATSLRAAEFKNNCALNWVSLNSADLRDANCSGVSFEGTDFTRARLEGAGFQDAVLVGANLRAVKWSEESWYDFFLSWNTRGRWGWRRWTHFGGKYQSPSQLDRKTDPLIAAYVGGEHQGWLIRKRHPFLGKVRYLLGNYERSVRRILFWAFVIWILFGTLYSARPLSPCLEGTKIGELLCWFSPRIDWGDAETSGGDSIGSAKLTIGSKRGTRDRQKSRHAIALGAKLRLESGLGRKAPKRRLSAFAPFYFSVVTMTTLGYGDITPHLGDWKAQFYVCMQTLIGYMLLGLLIVTLFRKAT